MIRRPLILGSMTLALLACSAPEQPPAHIVVSDGWTREIAPGQRSAAVYLTIVDAGGGGDHLMRVEAPDGQASLHIASSAGGVARMRPLENGLEIGPRSTVVLKPGGAHIMLTGLTKRPTQGETIQLTLGFERSGKRPIAIRVVAAAGDVHAGHSM
jgi:copper(I)-binding protein